MFQRMYRMDGVDGNGGAQAKAGSRRRGFAAMKPEQQREIASKGGRAISENRSHMAQIGRRGGVASHGGGRRPTVSASLSAE